MYPWLNHKTRYHFFLLKLNTLYIQNPKLHSTFTLLSNIPKPKLATIQEFKQPIFHNSSELITDKSLP